MCRHFAARVLSVLSHASRFNQSTASSFHKQIPWYHICVKHATVWITDFLQFSFLLHSRGTILHKPKSSKEPSLTFCSRSNLPPKKSTAHKTSSTMPSRSVGCGPQRSSQTARKQTIKRFSHPFPQITLHCSVLTMLLPNQSKFRMQSQQIPPPPSRKLKLTTNFPIMQTSTNNNEWVTFRAPTNQIIYTEWCIRSPQFKSYALID